MRVRLAPLGAAQRRQSLAVIRESRVCGVEGRRCRCSRVRSRHDEDASVFRRPCSTTPRAPRACAPRRSARRRRLVAARSAGGVDRTSRFLVPSPMRSSPRGHGIGEGGREGSTLQQKVRVCAVQLVKPEEFASPRLATSYLGRLCIGYDVASRGDRSLFLSG